MTKLAQDITMWQGEDTVITVPVTDSAGDPVALTGATAVRWSLFQRLDSTAAALAKTLGSGITLVNVSGTNDGVRITLTTGDTDDLAAGTYEHHECRVVDASNQEQVIFIGKLYLKRSRTND